MSNAAGAVKNWFTWRVRGYRRTSLTADFGEMQVIIFRPGSRADRILSAQDVEEQEEYWDEFVPEDWGQDEACPN